MIIVAPLFPQLYNTSDESKAIAVQIIVAQAIFMPQNAFIHAAYFTLRSGGKTIITFLFDSAFVWCVSVPVAYCLSRFTTVIVIVIFVMVQIADWIKCIIGFVLVKKGVWLQNIVTN
jgi:Na+-driven multidrug efflux pump